MNAPDGVSEERRIPRLNPEEIRLDQEAVAAAVAEAEMTLPLFGLRAAVALAFRAGLAVLKEASRRGAFFPIRSGGVVEGVHPDDVQKALEVIHHWGGLMIDGCRGEETIARAIAAVDAARELRAAKERNRYRHVRPLATKRLQDKVAQQLAARRAAGGPS